MPRWFIHAECEGREPVKIRVTNESAANALANAMASIGWDARAEHTPTYTFSNRIQIGDDDFYRFINLDEGYAYLMPVQQFWGPRA